MARRLNQQCRPAVRTHHTSHSADRSPSGQVPIINSVTSYNTVTSANTFQSLTDFTHHVHDIDVLHVGVKRDPTNFSTPAMRVTL